MMKNIYSLISYIMLLTVIFMPLFPQGLSVKMRGVFSIILAFSVLCLSVNEVSLLWYMRGTIGSLSLMTTLLLSLTLYSWVRCENILTAGEKKRFYPFVIMLSALLYLTTYHLSYVDFYALGIANQAIMLIILLITLVAWFKHMKVIAIGLCISVLGYRFDVLGSNNIWDYLLDPILICMAVFWSIYAIWSKILIFKQKEVAL